MPYSRWRELSIALVRNKKQIERTWTFVPLPPVTAGLDFLTQSQKIVNPSHQSGDNFPKTLFESLEVRRKENFGRVIF